LFNLDELDFDDNQYEISIPDEINAISSSFIMGLVGDSIKFLDESKFRDKYTISNYEKHRYAIETAITESLIEKRYLDLINNFFILMYLYKCLLF